MTVEKKYCHPRKKKCCYWGHRTCATTKCNISKLLPSVTLLSLIIIWLLDSKVLQNLQRYLNIMIIIDISLSLCSLYYSWCVV